MWGGTASLLTFAACAEISIHPPRVGWDFSSRPPPRARWTFQSTHPVWGGTMSVLLSHPLRHISIHPPRVGWDSHGVGHSFVSVQFQSTHPVWGGTQAPTPEGEKALFQSTHPVWGGTIAGHQNCLGLCDFNPPTPCGVGHGRVHTRPGSRIFQSTHPVWGGTSLHAIYCCTKVISIHPPRVGWDYGR